MTFSTEEFGRRSPVQCHIPQGLPSIQAQLISRVFGLSRVRIEVRLISLALGRGLGYGVPATDNVGRAALQHLILVPTRLMLHTITCILHLYPFLLNEVKGNHGIDCEWPIYRHLKFKHPCTITLLRISGRCFRP